MTDGAISSDDEEDFYKKGNALIRHYFKQAPEGMSIDDYAKLYNEAMFLKGFEMKKLAQLLVKIFGGSSG